MKKIISIALMIIVICSALILFKNRFDDSNISIKDNNLACSITYKGLKNSRDFAIDENQNFYIAYKDKIQYIGSNGKSYDLLNDKTLDITSMDYSHGKLYFASGSRVLEYDINSKKQKNLISEIPNFGDYRQSIVRVKGNEIYVTIGAATNSGVVGKDNTWLKDNPYNYDITPKDITLKGTNFGQERTGAFTSYKTKNIGGQLLPGHFPGNATVIKGDINTGYFETFAWGIRDILGLDFNSEGKVIASVGGMEERGLRPVKGDLDYIFEIKRGGWYGWPDYSGGDPVTSPKFKGQNNTKVNFILENHPTTNPPAPIYQHKYLSSIGSLAVDSKGKTGEKDCIYFYDNSHNMLYGLSKAGILKEKVSFNAKSKIASIKFDGKELIALDSIHGNLLSIHSKDTNSKIGLNSTVIYYLISVIIIGILIAIWKFIISSDK